MPADGEQGPTQSLHNALIAVCSIFFGLAVLATTGRVYSRVCISHNFGPEDALMLMGLALSAAHFGTGLATIQYGVGMHDDDVPDIEQSMQQILKYTIVSGVLFVLTMGFIKVSVLLFYFKTFPVRWFHITVMVLLCVIAGYTISCVFPLIFSCHPFQRAWDPSIPGTCINRFVVYYFQGSFNIFTDLAILLLPIPLIWSLHIPRREKAIIFGLIGICLLATGVSSARFEAIDRLETSGDLTWATALGIIFGQVEINLSIICGSMIVMRPFFRRYLPALINTSNKSSQPSMNEVPSTVHSV